MFAMMLGFAFFWGTGSATGRALRRTSGPGRRLRRFSEARSQMNAATAMLGLLCAGELVLETRTLPLPLLLVAIPAWLVFCFMGTALWNEAVRPGYERAFGSSRGLPRFEELLRTKGTMLVWRVAGFVSGLVVLDGHLTLARWGAVYLLWAVVSGLASPALLRLALPSRRPTRAEARRLPAIDERYGLRLGMVRICTASFGAATNAFVSGLWPSGSRICVTERLLETCDDDELAFVLAHEAAHRDQWHLAGRLVVTLLTTAGTVAVAVGLLHAARVAAAPDVQVGVLAALFGLLWLRRVVVLAWCRRDEYRADAAGARRVGVAAAQRGLARVAVQNGLPVAYRRGRELRSSHPAPQRRIVRATQAVTAAPVGSA